MWSSSVLRHANAPARGPVATAAVIALAFSVLGTGCDDDIEIYKPSKDEGPYLAQTSPENVLHNLAMSYTLRDYQHVVPLFGDDFTFFFAKEDEGAPGVPRSGIWGRAEELQATQHMLDPYYVPDDLVYKVAGIRMIVALVSSLEEADLEGAPHGTLKGRAALDMTIELDDGVSKLLVRSRPLFYFAPDGTGDPPVWRLWLCKDAPFDDELSGLGGCGLPRDDPGGSGVVDYESMRPIARAAQMGATSCSWGVAKSVYR